jgi:DNA-binding transcriptional regulator YhcF (GntR family)
MEMVRVDTQRAYQRIWEQITTLELAPSAPINEQQLAEELDMGVAPVREALRLLAHENLVVITPRHGLYVSDINIPDLEQISEMRSSLEALSASLAAQRATADDLVVLQALRQEQASVPAEDSQVSSGDRTSSTQQVPGPNAGPAIWPVAAALVFSSAQTGLPARCGRKALGFGGRDTSGRCAARGADDARARGRVLRVGAQDVSGGRKRLSLTGAVCQARMHAARRALHHTLRI